MNRRNQIDMVGFRKARSARFPAIGPVGGLTAAWTEHAIEHSACEGCGYQMCSCKPATPPTPEPPKPAGLYKPRDVVCLHSDSPEDAWDGKVTTVERMKGECIVVKGGGCYHTDFVELVRRAGEPAVDAHAPPRADDDIPF